MALEVHTWNEKIKVEHISKCENETAPKSEKDPSLLG